jgi:hypothetical protein
MAKLEIVWTGGPVAHTISYEIKSGLYMVRSAGERVSFTVVEGHDPLRIAPALKNTLDETGRTYVFAVEDSIQTKLVTTWEFPGKALVIFRPLMHVPSGRHPRVENAQLVIVPCSKANKDRRDKRALKRVRHPV